MRPKQKDRHLPSCVYLKHGAYYYVKKGKWRKIGNDLESALHEYARIVATPDGGLPDLIDKALPAIIAGKSDSTKTHYSYCARLLKDIFAEFRPDQVRHGDIVQMMDAYSHSVVTANRLLTVLRLVYKWALDRGLVETNPTVSVSRRAQPTRDRLITSHEYAAIYGQCPDWLQVIMDLCYLTGQRIGDVLTIERKNLLDEGIFFKQQKTGKLLVIAWTPELKAVVERAKSLPSSVHALQYLISTRGGKPRAHPNVWKAFKLAASRAGVSNVTLHDLRAMSGTEADRQGIDPTALLGHTDQRTTRVYLRDKAAKVVSGPRKKAG